ncbi:MAG: SusC/RagA family TonB-linked outer membrane protein [Prevotellaceae bacterium]|nr:SusC/RagA family TonB-linked outer membrane protein [Prevotellaceae bacterium]
MNLRKQWLAALLALCVATAAAQTPPIVKGIVIAEEDGLPVIGATVLIVGTNMGTATDFDGKFTLEDIPSSAKELQISFIGMATQIVAIQPELRIVLKNDAALLDEVVVVAYGTASRNALTGAIASVNAAEIEMRPVTNAAGALEGSAPGVQINNTYGEPGAKPTIRIRGFGSINGTNNPLIVVDGAIFEGNLTDISNSDIESISVLKDASSAALYGNKAANGVVLITTKKGKSDRIGLRVNVMQGIYGRGIPEYDRINQTNWMQTYLKGYQQYYLTDKKLDKVAAMDMARKTLIANVVKYNIYDKGNEALFDDNGKLTASVLPGYTDFNWQDQVERMGYRQEYGFSADTAGEQYDIFASASYLNEKGYVITSDFNRLSGRLKANLRPRTWLKTGMNLTVSTQRSSFADSAEGSYSINPFYTVRMMAPVYPYYAHDAQGDIIHDAHGDPEYALYANYLKNRHIIYELLHDKTLFDRSTMSGQLYATIDLPKGFAVTLKGVLNTIGEHRTAYNNPVIGDGAGNNGRLNAYDRKKDTYTVSQELTWQHDFGRHHIDVLAAHEAFKYKYTSNTIYKTNQKISGDNYNLSNFAQLTGANGYTDVYTTESYLGRVRYDYKNRYFLDASFRRDGSSRFYHPWGNFWSLGSSWTISDEAFMKPYRWVNRLKARLSYGEVGNDAGVDYYAYKALYASTINAGLGAYYKAQNMAKDLKWETSATLDFAVEARLFDRLNVSVDLFDKRSRDLLFNVNNPLSAGATDLSTGMSIIQRNIGSVSNLGLELALDVDIVRTDKWQWNVGLNATFLRNRIVSLPDGNDILNGLRMFSEGHSIYEFYTYVYEGVDRTNGRALYYVSPEHTDLKKNLASGKVFTIGDDEHFYTYDTAYGSKEWCGSALPWTYGSISTSVKYGNLTLAVLGTFSLGGKLYDSVYRNLMTMSVASPSAAHKDILGAWNADTNISESNAANRIDATGIPRMDLSSQGSYNTAASSRWLTDASYFVLKNIKLDYAFPTTMTDRMGVNGLNVFGTVENAFTLTARKGMNPQYNFSGGSDMTFVTARVFSLGLNIRL